MIEAIEHFPGSLRWTHARSQPPAVAEQERGEKRGHLPPVAERGGHKRGNRAIEINMIASLLLWLGPEHQFEELDVPPEVFVVAGHLYPDVRCPVEDAARQFKVVAGEKSRG